jgi:hypothetical protein
VECQPKPSAGGGKRKAEAAPPSQAEDKSQRTLFQAMPTAQRMFLPKSALRAVAQNGAVAHDALLEQVGLEVRAFPSEKTKFIDAVPSTVYWCDTCDRTFTTPQGLRLHKMHEQREPELASSSVMVILPRTFHGKIKVKLAITGSHVCVSLTVNDKTPETIAAEVKDDARATAESRAERNAEANRRRVAAANARLTADSKGGLERRGSAHRHQYSAYVREGPAHRAARQDQQR